MPEFSTTLCFFLFFCFVLFLFWKSELNMVGFEKQETSSISGCGDYLLKSWSEKVVPTGIYFFKVNNGNTRTMCEICWKLTIKITEWRHWRRSGVFIGNFDHISHIVQVFPLLTLNRQMSARVLPRPRHNLQIKSTDILRSSLLVAFVY